tara:strand:- start:9956 stop:10801 length:846 start_codon:yes stop_codon:yes gene_type:complete
MFELPKIQGTPIPRKAEDVIFFSCDYDYFDRHGYALAQSIVRTVGWIHVHCHIINEGNMKLELLNDLTKYPFTYTFENIGPTFYKDLEKNNKRMKEGRHIFKTDDLDFIARRTYLASCRFMRLKDLFDNELQHIFQLDCDTILRNGFHQTHFRELARDVRVMPKPKDPAVFIASALTLGLGETGVKFRKLFSDNMIEAFQKPIYWYVDQDVLKNTMAQWKNMGNTYEHIPYTWNAWGQKRHDIFSTGKGDKKNDKRFKAAQLNWLPEHWKKQVRREVLDLP